MKIKILLKEGAGGNDSWLQPQIKKRQIGNGHLAQAANLCFNKYIKLFAPTTARGTNLDWPAKETFTSSLVPTVVITDRCTACRHDAEAQADE